MEEENTSTLSTLIEGAIQEYVHSRGGGFVSGWVFMLDFIDSDGGAAAAIAHPVEQPEFRSLGLSGYLDEWFRDDARNTWRRAVE